MIMSVLLTMPSVTDCDSASGLPIASTTSPARELGRVAEARRRKRVGFAGFSFSTAMSESGSVPTSSAGTSSLLDSVQTIRCRRPVT